MKTLYPLGRIGGIRVQIHLLTLALPIAVIGYALWRGMSMVGMAWALVLVLAVLGCVLLHELGHALMAKYFRVSVHDILLLPIGGAARLDGLPKSPLQEAMVVFAGPFVNLLLALACAPALLGNTSPTYLWQGGYDVRSTLATLAVFNFLVFLVNLVPAFPLDGGRLLRALLSQWHSRLRATKLVTATARLFVLAGLGYAIYRGEYLFLLPLVYLFIEAGREVHLVSVQHFLESKRLGEFALPVRVFDPGVEIAEVAHQLQRNSQQGAVIADECSPIGFASLEMLQRAADPTKHVGDLELLTVVCHDSDADLRTLSHQFACHPHSVAIEEIDGRPAGYLDLEQLGNAYEAFAKTPQA